MSDTERSPDSAAPRDLADEGLALNSLPSTTARALAFASVLVAGICGGLIGYAVAQLQCTGSCTSWTVAGATAGTLIAAGGVAVVAVLVLRAMSEWAATAPPQ